jgi:hypothetical protein
MDSAISASSAASTPRLTVEKRQASASNSQGTASK